MPAGRFCVGHRQSRRPRRPCLSPGFRGIEGRNGGRSPDPVVRLGPTLVGGGGDESRRKSQHRERNYPKRAMPSPTRDPPPTGGAKSAPASASTVNHSAGPAASRKTTWEMSSMRSPRRSDCAEQRTPERRWVQTCYDQTVSGTQILRRHHLDGVPSDAGDQAAPHPEKRAAYQQPDDRMQGQYWTQALADLLCRERHPILV